MLNCIRSVLNDNIMCSIVYEMCLMETKYQLFSPEYINHITIYVYVHSFSVNEFHIMTGLCVDE